MRRRALLIPVGTLALILAGVTGAEIISENRSHHENPAVGTVSAAAAAVAPTVTLPPDFGASIAERTGAAIPRDRAATALCKTQPDAVRTLRGLSQQAPATVEALRDGLPVLEERLGEVQLAAEGRPGLAPIVKRLATVRSLWRTAVSAADAGHAKDAAKALAGADAELDALTADLQKAYPGNARDCPAVNPRK